MANTRDTIGDQATVDGLINHTLTALEEDGISIIGDRALYNNTALTSVNFPNATSIGEYAMAGCSALQTALVPKLATSGTYAFNNCISLESISMPQLATVSNYMFAGCSALSSVSIPNATRINQYAFQNCKDLTSIDLDGVTNIGNYAFSGTGIGTLVISDATSLGTYLCQGYRTGVVDQHKTVNLSSNRFNGANSLCHLILRSTTMCTLTANALTGTAIAAGIGWIYVPSDLVDTYKAATNWSTYASQIVAISEYPKALQDETISDSWATIFANEDNNTYKTVYSIGDIKYMYLNGTPMPMQIVAFDEDTSKISWVCKSILDTHNMNPTGNTTGGWASSNMRAWLRETIYPMIDSTIRNRIVAVTKNYYDAKTSSRLTISDTVWIPSEYEVFGTTTYENTGTLYTGVFSDATSRIKKYGLNGSASYWWLRSAGSGAYFRCVYYNGSAYNSSASYAYGVVLGFCT